MEYSCYLINLHTCRLFVYQCTRFLHLSKALSHILTILELGRLGQHIYLIAKSREAIQILHYNCIRSNITIWYPDHALLGS